MIKKFNSKKDISKYLRKKFSTNSNIVLIRGSSAKRPLKKFSDIDIEIHGKKKKPYYEIVLLKNKPILISAYFYEYKNGKSVKEPKDIKIIYGKYNNKIKPDFSPDTYNPKQKIVREAQLAIDFFFKYLRTKNIKYLESVEKRLK